jgi:DNA mismatch repair protein MutL
VSRIRVLSDALIDRIAAGEVVERPASVVKELIENSLDADAAAIEVECAGGGRRLIQVSDDGCGMDRDDALLAVQRHATSKLASISELDSIATFGFRGEALSSIAAVSRFTLRTSPVDGGGTEIEVHGGKIHAVREAGLPRGTTVRAERLFFNVPARRKFLRSEATELGHIARLMTRFALAHPRRRFALVHGGRMLLRVDPAQDLLGRIAEIYGREFAEKLMRFDLSAPGLRVHGFAGRPAEALPRRDGQHFFVNGRAIQDRMLLHAVSQAYGNTMPRGRHPSLFLFLDCDPSTVDVNVHPQKTEVRFGQPSAIHDVAARAVASALSDRTAVPALGDLRPSPAASAPLERVEQALTRSLQREPHPAERFRTTEPAGERLRYASSPESVRRGLKFEGAPAGATAPRLGEPEPRSPSVVPLAQYRNSYILAQDADGLMLVDQHAAHERVLFERYLEQAAADRVEVQKLLFPVTVELTPAEHVVLERELEEFRRLGFVIEPFGEHTVRIDGVPAVAAELDPRELLMEMLGEAGSLRSTVADSLSLRRKLVTSAACQAAIKVNHPLERLAMQRLLDDLFRTVNPSTCPHGRPLVFRLTHDEIERAFKRR